MSQLDLRPRSASDIIDAAFVFYRRSASVYIMLTAIAAVPGLLLNIMALKSPQVELGPDLFRFVPAILVGIVTFAWSGGVVQRLGSHAFLGEEVELTDVVRNVTRHMPSLMAATLLVVLLAALGLILFIVPAFYAVTRWFAAPSAVAIEGVGPLEALGRSSHLTANRKGHVFGTLALTYVVVGVLNGGVLLLVRALPTAVLPLIVSTAFGIVLQPVVTLTAMLLYYDLRVRNEGFDLEHMARTLDVKQSSPMSSPAY